MTTLYHFQMIGLFEAKSPIIHTEETIGNVARIKRIKVLDAGAPVSVPALSGNSFRGQLRDLIGDHFIEMVRENDSPVTMSPLMYGVIFSGGVLRAKYKELGTHMKTLMQTVPLLRVMGSAFGDRMMPSKISVSHLVPLAQETASYLADTLAGFPESGHALAERLAEYRANYAGKRVIQDGAPIMSRHERVWRPIQEVNWDKSDFETIGADFDRDTDVVSHGQVANAPAQLFPQPALVDYAVTWLEHNRK